ncbi:hypothetical protein D9M68_875200 [compost metagenome]
MAQIAPIDTFWQKFEESLKVHRIEFLRAHELPVDDAELVFQLKKTAGHKFLDALACFSQNPSIGRKAWCFQRKYEVIRRLIMPLGESRRFLGAIIGAVDFDRSQLA